MEGTAEEGAGVASAWERCAASAFGTRSKSPGRVERDAHTADPVHPPMLAATTAAHIPVCALERVTAKTPDTPTFKAAPHASHIVPPITIALVTAMHTTRKRNPVVGGGGDEASRRILFVFCDVPHSHSPTPSAITASWRWAYRS